MAAVEIDCVKCGEPLPPEAPHCPHCGADRPAASADAPSRAAPKEDRARGGSGTERRSAELTRRIARLKQWDDTGETLGVRLPALPAWAEEVTRHGHGGDAWLEVVRGVERLAQKQVVAALEIWEKATRNRLTRLEAYSVDGRLERDQIDDVLHAARHGEITQALQTFQQVDRVVSLKERHLDQAREELERLVSMLRDMDALGLDPPLPPGEASEDLEGELRGGRLVALKQRLRSIRLQAVGRLKTGVPAYVTEYGTFLVRERGDGVAVELEAAELARAAQSFVRGQPEESLRRLRVLQQVHGTGFVRGSGRLRGENSVTGSSRAA
ncbi:MAG: zinc ribbon domain-containing protein [Thermoplasmata archaeon]|nr:zinc ribbon domain-containing protein [Thermoplasmata archaeon]